MSALLAVVRVGVHVDRPLVLLHSIPSFELLTAELALTTTGFCKR